MGRQSMPASLEEQVEMISTIAIRNYLAFLKERAVSAEAVLANTKLDVKRLSEANCMLEDSQYRTIIGNIIKLPHSEGIGFELAKRIDLPSLGVVGHAASTCETVRDAHRLWCRFGRSLAGIMGRLDLHSEDEHTVLLSVGAPDVHDPLYQFAVEEILGLAQMVGKPLANDAVAPIRLTVSYPMPRHADRYRALFNCPIQFDAPQSTLLVPRTWFDQPVRTHDSEFNLICLQHCEGLSVRLDGAKPTRMALRNYFTLHNDRPLPSLEEAAAYLNLTPRTLRRHLQAEATSFRAEIDAYRAEKAKTLLSFGALSPKETAYLLGFKEQSAFRHAFKAWTGQTISEYRGHAGKIAPVVAVPHMPS